MTRKRYIKLTIALFDKINMDVEEKHIDGEMIRWLRSRRVSDFKGVKSYQEAWDKFYTMRMAVLFNERGTK